jgi:uncharacterized protein involved in type VI secretion and phage assembly
MKVAQEGVLTAFVEEVDAEQGRVKVRYSARDEDLVSPWAPVAAPLSGKARGALFMPEKDDEVLVGFADGDFCSPYVLGFLWNGVQKSPENTADNRVIVTPGGHQLRFEDKQGAQRIVIKSNKHSITLDDDGGPPSITLQAGTSGVGVTITMTAQGSLTISVGATNRFEIGPSGVSLTTTSPLQVNCSTANITASGATTLTTGLLNVSAGAAIFSGAVIASSIVTNAIVSPMYSPGVGNLI